MTATKKGKKTSKPKKGSKGKKKGNGLNFFPKLMLALLAISVIITAIFLTLGNFSEGKSKGEGLKNEVIVREKTQTQTQTLAKAKAEAEEGIKSEDKVERQETKKDLKKEAKTSKVIKGCWLSSEQGASLTFDEYGYRIDFFNVSAPKPITGNYTIEDNLIVFTSDGDVCDNTKGHYRITFYKNDFSLICKDDECTNRRNILEADWEWIEI